MLARLSVVLFAVSVVLAGGSAGYGDQGNQGGHESGSCDTGSVQCCDEYEEPSSENYPDFVKGLDSKGLLDELNIPVEDIHVPIAVGCVSPTVLGAGLGNGCGGTTTCCENVMNNGVGVNCLPIDLNV